MTHNRNRRAAALTFLGLVSATAVARDPPVLSLGMEHFRDTASITDGAVSVAISTEPGFVAHRGPLRTVWNDEYLRAMIDKTSGAKSFEVETSITYAGARRAYQRAAYETPSGRHEAAVTLTRVTTANCAVECMYTEYLTFPIEEPALRDLASAYVSGKPTLWHFKVMEKSGPAYQGEISNAEIAGLLAKVDGYSPGTGSSQGTGSSPGPAVGATVPPSPRPVEQPHSIDFGVSGIAVTASPDRPDRAGLLVAGVTQGSPAQTSGVIIGDIIYGLDARRIKAPSDLQAAVAGLAAGSTSVLELYRGTDKLALPVRF
jgi:PDZ domain